MPLTAFFPLFLSSAFTQRSLLDTHTDRLHEMAAPYPYRPGLSGISLAISLASTTPASPSHPAPPAPAPATGDEIEEIPFESNDSSEEEIDMSVILCTGKWASSQESPRILWSKS